jgi:hypothetical protein
MMRGAWVLLAVLVCVSIPRLGAEEVKIIGRDFAFDAPAMLGAGMTTFSFENPGDVQTWPRPIPVANSRESIPTDMSSLV